MAGFLLFDFTCYEAIQVKEGIYILRGDDRFFMSCNNGFRLDEGSCLKFYEFPQWVIDLCIAIGVLLLVALVAFVVLKVVQKKNRVQYEIFKNVAKRYIRFALIDFVLIVLAQIISVSGSLQNSFESQFHGYGIVMLITSIPFLLVFSFYEKPNLTKFLYERDSQVPLFASYVGLDFLFSVISSFVLPLSMQSQQSYFQTIATPILLVLFIVVMHQRFEKVQIYSIVFVVLVCMCALLVINIVESFQNSAFFGGTDAYQLYFLTPVFLVIMVVITVQTNLLYRILKEYSVIEALSRVAFFQFLFGFVISSFCISGVVAEIT